MAACNSSSRCFDFVGKAKHRIEIFGKTLTDDDYGGQSTSFGSLGTFWAFIQETSMNEQVMSEQLQSKVTHKIVIRYQSQFKDTKTASINVIRFDGRYFEIKGVANLDGTLKEEGKEYQMFRTC